MVPGSWNSDSGHAKHDDHDDEKQNEIKGVASLEELRELCVEAEVRIIACQMTVDLFDLDPKAFIDGVEFGGAALFFEFAGEADISLFM